MSSLRARLLPSLLRLLLQRRLRPRVPLWQQRAALNIWAAFGHLPRRTEVAAVTLAGRPAERVQPRGLPQDRDSLLLLHGGGYCWGGLYSYREFAARLAHASRRPVTVLDYRRAPEHPYPAALDDAVAAVEELRQLRPDQPLAIVGDSAGGGLALALCLRLRSLGQPLPERLGLISPWTDLTQSGASIETLASREPVISLGSLEQCASRYAGDHDRSVPELSPLFGELTGFPPTLIQVGANEILLDDSRRLAERLGSAATLEIAPDLWHVWHLFASIIPESQAAIERLGTWLRDNLPEQRTASAP